jgi:hypothetical protein
VAASSAQPVAKTRPQPIRSPQAPAKGTTAASTSAATVTAISTPVRSMPTLVTG